MPRDVVISYQTQDSETAGAIRDALEAQQIGCWMAPRDIRAGVAWGAAIVEAIAESKVLLLVGSAHAFASRQVARELERADSKGKVVLPVMIEPVVLSGEFEYYLGRVHHFPAHPAPVGNHLAGLLAAVRALMTGGSPAAAPAAMLDASGDEQLVALGRSICHNIREELSQPAVSGDAEVLQERRPGQTVNPIDIVCNRQARQTVASWQKRYGCKIRLVGEDLAPALAPRTGEDIVVCIDGLDGTQHWIRGRNLYATALSIFSKKPDGGYALRVSLVHHSQGSLFIAREDKAAAYIDGESEVLHVHTGGATTLEQAHVCTVARRPGHYEVLVPLLRDGSPFSGLYLFGGNPVLVELPLSRYDALFQPDAAVFNDSQDLWDWLPGMHVAYRSGCTVLDGRGEPADVPAIAEASLASGTSKFSYVVAGNAELASGISTWLRRV